jgi:hypothetical protein
MDGIVAAVADRIMTLIVGEDHHDVWPRGRRGSSRRKAGCQGGQKKCESKTVLKKVLHLFRW